MSKEVFTKQTKATLPVINYNKIKYNNHKLLPSIYRMLILGKTGSGKSTLLFKLLLDKIIDYEEIYICSPTVFQPEYQLIINAFNKGLNTEHIKMLFEYQNELSKDKDGKPDFNYAINKISDSLNKGSSASLNRHLLNNSINW